MILFSVVFLVYLCALLYKETGDDKFLMGAITLIAIVTMAADILFFW